MPRRRLILMRHATAATGAGRDIDRPLNRRGLEEAQHVGERLQAAGPLPDRVLASSARRCRETWHAVSSCLAAEQRSGIAVEFEDRLYNASTGTLLEILHDETAAEVLLVLAHNPGISRLAFELGGANAEDESVLRDGFAPATLAVFEVSGEWRDLSASATRLERFERAD